MILEILPVVEAEIVVRPCVWFGDTLLRFAWLSRASSGHASPRGPDAPETDITVREYPRPEIRLEKAVLGEPVFGGPVLSEAALGQAVLVLVHE
jgi:hypothetical protein